MLEIRKAPLPRGRSFILRSGILDAALDSAGLEIETILIYTSTGTFFTAEFWPPIPAAPHDRLYIVTGTVAAQSAAQARVHMAHEIVPKFVDWAQRLIRLPENSPERARKQTFSCAPGGTSWCSNRNS
jgi:hypothetical protein